MRGVRHFSVNVTRGYLGVGPNSMRWGEVGVDLFCIALSCPVKYILNAYPKSPQASRLDPVFYHAIGEWEKTTIFISEKLVYLALQKTGSTQIRHLLTSIIPGELIGTHNRLPVNLSPKRIAVGSIRNPWAWYVSLWAFGCLGRGGFYHKVAGCPGTWTWLVRNVAVSAAQSGGKTRRHLRRFMKSRRYPHDRWLEKHTGTMGALFVSRSGCVLSSIHNGRI